MERMEIEINRLREELEAIRNQESAVIHEMPRSNYSSKGSLAGFKVGNAILDNGLSVRKVQ